MKKAGSSERPLSFRFPQICGLFIFSWRVKPNCIANSVVSDTTEIECVRLASCLDKGSSLLAINFEKFCFKFDPDAVRSCRVSCAVSIVLLPMAGAILSGKLSFQACGSSQ